MMRWWTRYARPRPHGEPESRLFAGIRLRLTVWYSGVLAAALLLFGVTLYIGLDRALLNPIDDHLHRSAAQISMLWRTWPALNCRGPRAIAVRRPPLPAYWACISVSGTRIIRASTLAEDLPSPQTDPLIQSALRAGSASDTLKLGSGAVRRFATVVTNPLSGAGLGVIEVAMAIQTELDALHILLTLLLVLGAVALCIAVLGGLLLSRRALAPAHLALQRQQHFIADASHELRTPLTLMRADAEVLLRGRDKLAPEDAALLEDIVAETSHMAHLAANMLTLARIDAGRQQMERDVVDLAEVAASIAQRADALAHAQGVTITMDGKSPVIVVGDCLLLEQATLVLIDNAIKYNRPGGQVTISVRRDERSRLALVHVADTGIGIPPEHLPHLGERFYRVDKDRSREAGGAGLGLSIARGIAALHGGALILTSTPGQGTVATLRLPAASHH